MKQSSLASEKGAQSRNQHIGIFRRSHGSASNSPLYLIQTDWKVQMSSSSSSVGKSTRRLLRRKAQIDHKNHFGDRATI
jgi:hypothetical protein